MKQPVNRPRESRKWASKNKHTTRNRLVTSVVLFWLYKRVKTNTPKKTAIKGHWVQGNKVLSIALLVLILGFAIGCSLLGLIALVLR